MSSTFDTAAALRLLGDLHQIEREVVEVDLVRRTDAVDRVREAVRRIGDIASPTGILDRAAAELGESARFDRVLVSQIRGKHMVPRGLWPLDVLVADAWTELREHGIALDYPLVEAEAARQQRTEMVDLPSSAGRSPNVLRELLGWSSYVLSALTLRGTTIGLVHAGRVDPEDSVDALDLELVSIYGDGLAGAFERAVLRTTLQQHRDELRSAVSWLGGNLGRSDAVEAGEASRPVTEPDRLSPRELQVLGLVAAGRTNAGIAKELVISESTVKFHVKNVLSKLGASSRADAVARQLRREA